MVVTESVPDSAFDKASGLTMSGNDRVYDRFCDGALSSLRL